VQKLTQPSRPVVLSAAILVAAASIVYSVIWMVYVRTEPSAYLGIEWERRGHSPLVLTKVVAGTPAERAGLMAGDRVRAINGRPLESLDPFHVAITRGQPGDRVTFEVERPPALVTFTIEAIVAAPPGSGEPLTLARRVVLEIIRSYPLLFLIVGLVVLLERIEDRHAWLLALMLAGFIAAAPLDESIVHPSLRLFSVLYVSTFFNLLSGVFYYFFAVFPAASPLDRRWPWLKSVAMAFSLTAVLVLGAARIATGNVDVIARHLVGRLFLTGESIVGYGFLGLGLVSLVWNSLRPTSAEVRRKTRVIVWGALCSAPAVTLRALSDFTGRDFDAFPFWIWTSTVLLLLILPLSFAYAVVKDQVLEIPVLLKRSARYLLVLRGFSLLLLIVCVAATLLFAEFARSFVVASEIALPIGTGFGVMLVWLGIQSQRRLTRRLDRAFFRSAYDARRILEDLAEKARSATDRSELAGLLERHLVEALHPAALVIYLKTGTGMLERVTGDVPRELEKIASDQSWVEAVSRAAHPIDTSGPDGVESAGPLVLLDPQCVVPILGREARLLGVVALGPRLSDEPYSGEDRRLLAAAASQAGITLENLSLAERMAERIEAERRADHEIKIAQEVQQKLFPQRMPAMATLDYAGACLQARVVGGDYYDFLDLGTGRLVLVLADISGKGISAALLMAHLQANLRSQYVVALDDVPRLLESVHRLFYESTTPNRFATLFFAKYEDEGRRLTYVNCGHNPPLLLRGAGVVEWLTPTATALGFFDEWTCTTGVRQLAPGDTLVVFSDGMTEATSDGGEEYGDARLLAAVQAHNRLAAPLLLDRLMSEARSFSEGEQEDDMTLIVAHAR
jgi:sigma-B regulation protein RsbU (phosphoserine phosphatase)